MIENAFHQQACEVADLMSASRIQKAIENNEMAAAVKDFVTLLPGRYKNCGWRIVNFRFIGGTFIPIKVVYYARNCDKNKHNTRTKEGG
ncbi:MAG: hypothetical protein KTR17_12550 [Cellvibrionaceae bacterium]|nr:hypothetical protein [Cellvibrionaceae bacterium]